METNNYTRIDNKDVTSYLDKIRNINLLILHPILFVIIIGGYSISFLYFNPPVIVYYICFLWVFFPIYLLLLLLNWSRLYFYSKTYLLYIFINSIWGSVVLFLLIIGASLILLSVNNKQEFIKYIYYAIPCIILIHLYYYFYYYKKWKLNWEIESFKYISLIELNKNTFDVINPYQKLEEYPESSSFLFEKLRIYAIPASLTVGIVLPIIVGISTSSVGFDNMNYLLLLVMILYIFIIPSLSKMIAKNYILYRGIKNHEQEKGIIVYNGMWK